jgi:hypothetical protein
MLVSHEQLAAWQHADRQIRQLSTQFGQGPMPLGEVRRHLVDVVEALMAVTPEAATASAR